MRSLAALILLGLLSACASAPPEAPTAPPPARTAWIVGQDGSAIGQASLTPAPGGVLIRLEFSGAGMTPGWHGAHVHETGGCADVAGAFAAAGAHVGHAETLRHGLLHPGGPEPGDLPNVFAPPSGPFGAEFLAPNLVLGAEALDGRLPLLDADGASLIIHAGPDDHLTQPIGGAGARIGCAAISVLP